MSQHRDPTLLGAHAGYGWLEQYRQDQESLEAVAQNWTLVTMRISYGKQLYQVQVTSDDANDSGPEP